MKLNELAIKGVFEIELEPHIDSRGFFMRTYEETIFKEHGLNEYWPHENQSFSKDEGIVRGLHFQRKPFGETKLVRAVSGELYFVAVDLRKDSETFGQWVSSLITEENKKMLYTPEGFATGFCTLTNNCNLAYKMGNVFNPDYQGEIAWNDSDLNIKWPIQNPILSKRDLNAMSFKQFLDKYQFL
ncbi:MAG: dTDP-4-dehydrorhamnose 3,5-epimerase [archaeon]|nr:dTDP-4-dehydrorhamnose 3,5-epimerase [archaeon]